MTDAAVPDPGKPAPKPAAAGKRKAAPQGMEPKTQSARGDQARAATSATPAQGQTESADPLAEPMQTIEQLSVNLAKAAMIAQGAIAEAALRKADRPAGFEPDPFHVSPAMTQVMGKLASEPEKLLRAQADLFARYADLWQANVRKLGGDEVAPVAAPPKGDKRFADPAWSENPVFDTIKQSYLITSNWLNSLVTEVEDVEPTEKRRVEFFTRMLTDAFSPSNFLASNPAALREALDTKGESLVRGMQNFAEDMARGGGELAIRQTDLEQFEVGRDVATAPGKVVFQNELIQLLQFAPSTEKAHKTPLLIFPPWINKFYILDLRPENSMIRWLTGQGFTVFVVSWVNPGPELAERDFEDYLLHAVYPAIEQTLVQTGEPQVNAVGYCIGGTMLSCALAHMAAKGINPIASATFFAAQQDFSEAGDLKLFTDEDWLRVIEIQMENAGGVLPGQAMAGTFNSLRANDLIWSFFVNNYLMGREPKPFDLLYWNSDQTRMPKALHLFYLRRFYNDNALAKGELELAGERLDLSKVKIPVYAQSSKEDHIAPARSVYRGAHLFGGPVTFTMAGSGHIAGVINHPDAKKYQHWVNDHLPGSLDGWLAEAKEQPGSWWPHWAKWLKAKSGPMIAARDPSAGALKPVEDAPGSYVKVKS
ncbi:MAG TPA: class I poly(R)-hydroxyalkanoic acid synthase [Caulobacteraceae bacterium]|jgi:polyhydroxyalkanoate synthase